MTLLQKYHSFSPTDQKAITLTLGPWGRSILLGEIDWTDADSKAYARKIEDHMDALAYVRVAEAHQQN